MQPPDVSVVVVTYNALPWLEQCLESVRGHEVVVVDHGSNDGTLSFVRERFPDVRIVVQENKGMGGGNNAGMRVATGRYFFLLNSDAWVLGDGLERLAAYAEAHPEAAVVGPRLRNRDGTLQRSVRAEPTLWRLATEYLFLRKLAPRTNLLNPLYVGGFDHETETEADWLFGAALLVRREAADAVGLFDEDFFMFSEEVDWMTRFRRAGWKVLFFPGAEVVHVGGASHGGGMYVENLRGHLRFFAKQRGPKEAERVRKLLLWSLRLRALVLRRDVYREGVRFLSSGDAATLTK
ncbi:MAG TPA: glycosyltransferase family 2 protein [Gaiellaceae bacterium]|nr:glycosyltransferase family 2 protein [Gaiellaceae bacterium]